MEFRDQWFRHPEWWFDSSHDDIIVQQYSNLLDRSVFHDPLTTILVFDQLSRHVYRGTFSNHIIEYFLQKAVQVVHEHIYTDYYNQLGSSEFTFYMLPLRHTKDPTFIKLVLSETWKRLKSSNDHDVYRRFLKATYKQFINHVPNQLCLMSTPRTSTICYKHILAYDGVITTPETVGLHSNISAIDIKKPIIISLSGGVDSMVCSWLLRHQYPELELTAIHINYDNRKECDVEVAFIRHWCSLLKITLYIRKIDEIHRAECMEHELRDVYETYTRQVRYASYKSLGSLPQVILGHNKDDCLENIMTNIAHKHKYDNLVGMHTTSTQDDIIFTRPLIHVNKKDIIAFAHSKGIPYLPNSTPTWSQRGQIRTTIVPCLDTWDKRMIPSLFDLSSHMSMLHEILDQSVRTFVNAGQSSSSSFATSIDISTLSSHPLFWKQVIHQLFDMDVSHKSLENLEKAIQKFIINKEARTVNITKYIKMLIKMKTPQNAVIDIINEKQATEIRCCYSKL